MPSSIGAQYQRTSDSIVNNGGNIFFDTALVTDPDIDYNPSNAEFTLVQTGVYIISWWVSTQASASRYTSFSISSNTSTAGNTPNTKDQLSGSTILNVTNPNQTFSLRNTSGEPVKLGVDTPIKANLSILKGSSSTLENLVDGNSEGSVYGINSPPSYTMGVNAIAIGENTIASRDNSFSQGLDTIANAANSHAEGVSTQASGNASHAEGNETTASGIYSHSEGDFTTASGSSSHAEGRLSAAVGDHSHAEGLQTEALGDYSHSEGNLTDAIGEASHAEGFNNIASGNYSHAEGRTTQATGEESHSQGLETQAIGRKSHAAGDRTQAIGENSHAIGNLTVANTINSFTAGDNTSSDGVDGAFVIGRFGGPNNATQGIPGERPYGFFIANGNAVTRSLSAMILNNGQGYATAWNTGGADYGEMFESSDGKEIKPGYFVTFDNNDKIRIANSKDKLILGITTKTSGIIGNNNAFNWEDKYLKDEWGAYIYNNEHERILNPKYDDTKEFISRQQRCEWVVVGLLGQILVRDDGSSVVGGYCSVGDDGIATSSEYGYPVTKRINDNQILVMFNSISSYNEIIKHKSINQIEHDNLSEQLKQHATHIDKLEKYNKELQISNKELEDKLNHIIKILENKNDTK